MSRNRQRAVNFTISLASERRKKEGRLIRKRLRLQTVLQSEEVSYQANGGLQSKYCSLKMPSQAEMAQF